MFRKAGMFVVALMCGVSTVKAQTMVNAGLFVKNYDYHYEANNGFNISVGLNGYTADQDRNLSLSLKSGAFLFAVESLSDDDFNKMSISSSGSRLSGSSRTEKGDTHRAVLGVMLANNVALYGFQGLTEQQTDRSLSYYDSSTTSVIYGCGYKKNITNTTTGFSENNVTDLQQTIGAGVEAALWGGVVRLEYGATRILGGEQTIALKHESSDPSFQASGPNSITYNWADSMNQSVQLRWKTNF